MKMKIFSACSILLGVGNSGDNGGEPAGQRALDIQSTTFDNKLGSSQKRRHLTGKNELQNQREFTDLCTRINIHVE